jgi:transposase-like protein
MPESKRRRRGREERLALAEQWISSGRSAAAFARQVGVAVGSLRRWCREFRAERAAAFVEIDVPGPEADRCAPEEPGIELVVAGGHCIRIGPGFDESTLVRVLAVLRNAS